jgi:hypothetical protein
MGYRSDVVLAVGKEIMPHFMAALSRNEEASRMVFKHADDLVKDYQGEGNMLIRWSSIKWYENYEDINAIQAFINDPSDFGPETVGDEGTAVWDCFKFVRIGEEPDDIQTEGGGFYDIYVERSITY